MKSVLISTIPRSGTWAIRYLLRFAAHFAERGPQAPFDIREIRGRALDLAENSYLRCVGIEQVVSDHFTFPGKPERSDFHPYGQRLGLLKQRLGFNAFDGEQQQLIADYEPVDPEQRCVLIHRNVFEQFLSLLRTDLAAKRSFVGFGPANSQWPIDTSVFIDLGHDAPLQAYVERILSTQTIECFALYMQSFLAGAVIHGTERGRFFRYETLNRTPRAFAMQLFRFIGAEMEDAVLDAAVDAISKPKMREYEKILGQPLSSNSGVASHLGHVDDSAHYSNFVSPDVARRVKARLDLFSITKFAWRAEDDALLDQKSSSCA